MAKAGALTARDFISELRNSELTVDQLARDQGYTYAKINRWRRKNKWFRERYDAIMSSRLKADRLKMADVDQLYPGWKTLFLSMMDEQLPDQPKISEACRMLQNLGVPISEKHIYAYSAPRSKLYDPEFSIELAACEAPVVNLIKERLESDLIAGKNQTASLQYLKAHKMGPLEDKSAVAITHGGEVAHQHRHQIRASVVEESKALGDNIKKRLEASDAPTKVSSEAAEFGGDGPDVGTVEGGDAEEEDVIEGEVVVEEEAVGQAEVAAAN